MKESPPLNYFQKSQRTNEGVNEKDDEEIKEIEKKERGSEGNDNIEHREE